MPTLGESIARRRVFWALVVLVVGPTIALFAYGLAGIKDRVDAEEGRQHERYSMQARELESAVLARLGQEDDRLRQTLTVLEGPALDFAMAAYGRNGGPIHAVRWAADPESPTEASAVAVGLSEGQPVAFLSSASGSGAMAVSRVQAGVVVTYEISADWLDAVALPEAVGQRFPNERSRYHLRVIPIDPPGEPVSFEGLRRALALSLVEEEAFVSRPMAAPFSHWRIEVEPANLPAEKGMRGLRWTMVILFTATVIGVILMGRAITQQTRLSNLQTDFVSHVSHELRTPLTSIRLFVETLQSGRVTEPERVQECLAVISSETDRLSRMIERMLMVARMEAGRREYAIVPVRPDELAHRALIAFRGHVLHGQVDIDVDVASTLPPVYADAEAIGEALLNLLSNARKHGGPNVKIALRANVENDGVVFVVEDDGPGIPLLDQRRVFEKFYRADSLLSRRTEGSGLGLTIVAGIAAAHRGRVWLDSVEGAGSRFSLWLPCRPRRGKSVRAPK